MRHWASRPPDRPEARTASEGRRGVGVGAGIALAPRSGTRTRHLHETRRGYYRVFIQAQGLNLGLNVLGVRAMPKPGKGSYLVEYPEQL